MDISLLALGAIFSIEVYGANNLLNRTNSGLAMILPKVIQSVRSMSLPWFIKLVARADKFVFTSTCKSMRLRIVFTSTDGTLWVCHSAEFSKKASLSWDVTCFRRLLFVVFGAHRTERNEIKIEWTRLSFNEVGSSACYIASSSNEVYKKLRLIFPRSTRGG